MNTYRDMLARPLEFIMPVDSPEPDEGNIALNSEGDAILYDEAHIRVCELDGPNCADYDSLHETTYNELLDAFIKKAIEHL